MPSAPDRAGSGADVSRGAWHRLEEGLQQQEETALSGLRNGEGGVESSASDRLFLRSF